MADEVVTPVQLEFKTQADFIERYANNVRFESSVWDLRLILGTLDQATQPHTIHVHTAVNVPWQQAKLMAYFLYLHVLFQEAGGDAIKIPEGVMPPPIEPAMKDLMHLPGTAPLLEKVRKLRSELLGRND
jgi:hypothetical protein